MSKRGVDPKPRLLIVDDDELDRRFLARLIKQQHQLNWEVIWAGTGQAGLGALGARLPDCILLDSNLPDMTGLEFMEQAGFGVAIPCALVLITSAGSETVAVEAIRLGAQDYLVKEQMTGPLLSRTLSCAVRQVRQRGTQKRQCRVLVVDDDVIDQRNYHRLLAQAQNLDFSLDQAMTGEAGLLALGGAAPDCILLDFKLPDMTGLEFLSQAGCGGGLPCAVVVVTGQGDELVAAAAMKLGARDYLIKENLTGLALSHAIAKAVTEKQLQQRLDQSLRELRVTNAALEREVASRRAAERELRAATVRAEQGSQAKSRFVAMMSHEMRTPLQCILGYAELLRLDGGLSSAQGNSVNAMLQAGQHLLDMIEKVLDFASIEAGRLQVSLGLVPVRSLAEDCVALVRPMAAEHALDLRLTVDRAAPAHIHADPVRLRQVLLNLLGNALKYTPSGSVEVRVRAGRALGSLRLEVADTGPGIDLEARERLFHGFERLNAERSVEGAGLGLALAARMVGLMQGEIGYSPNQGGGSLFWLELPPGEVARDQLPGEPAAPPKTQGKRLMVVDDIALNREVIGAFLRAAGHQVLFATSGPEAISLAIAEHCDLILMDVRMPGMDGLEATRRIRALPGARGQVPIMAVTANAFQNQVADCTAAGMQGHVAKPVSFESLTHAVDAALARVVANWTEARQAKQAADADRSVPTGLDRSRIDEMSAYLQPSQLRAHLASLHERLTEFVELLDRPAAPDDLADAAHALASVAGFFGFTHFASMARQFERELLGNVTAAGPLAQNMRQEAQSALRLARDLASENAIADL